jgi:hypothetical protein
VEFLPQAPVAHFHPRFRQRQLRFLYRSFRSSWSRSSRLGRAQRFEAGYVVYSVDRDTQAEMIEEYFRVYERIIDLAENQKGPAENVMVLETQFFEP